MNAKNLALADISIDAKIGDRGIGIKTFIESNKKTLQKIAEFNKQQELYTSLPAQEKIRKISELRNKRIEFTKTAYALNDMIYHCIVRNQKGFHLYDEPMHEIDIDNLKLLSSSSHSIFFTDGIEEYRFDGSKSTLYKRFCINK